MLQFLNGMLIHLCKGRTGQNKNDFISETIQSHVYFKGKAVLLISWKMKGKSQSCLET